MEANQEAYERKLKYSNSEINDLQQKLDSMVNPITGEMSFEERTKESWKKEESKESKVRAPEKSGMAKPQRQQPAPFAERREEKKTDPFDYFSEEPKKAESRKVEKREEELKKAEKEEKEVDFFKEPMVPKKEEKRKDYGFALDELEDVDFSKKEDQQSATGGVIPNSLFD